MTMTMNAARAARMIITTTSITTMIMITTIMAG
jgi:hypothetical protein